MDLLYYIVSFCGKQKRKMGTSIFLPFFAPGGKSIQLRPRGAACQSRVAFTLLYNKRVPRFAQQFFRDNKRKGQKKHKKWKKNFKYYKRATRSGFDIYQPLKVLSPRFMVYKYLLIPHSSFPLFTGKWKMRKKRDNKIFNNIKKLI